MRDFGVGNISVGIIIVDGKTGTEAAFTAGEKLNVAIEVSQGFDLLYRLKSKASMGGTSVPLFFMTRTDVVKLDLDPALVPAPPAKGTEANTSDHYERREKIWRDPALQALGLSSGETGVSQYRQKLMEGSAWAAAPSLPDLAYVVFVTKYMAKWMAYARPSAGKITVCYPWVADKTETNADGTGGFRNTGSKGWGEENFDRVFAHESCHIFGAPDEYKDSNCNGSVKAGHLKIENRNCAMTNPGSVPCLMKDSTESLCSDTPGHLGWVDRNGNGVLDVFES